MKATYVPEFALAGWFDVTATLPGWFDDDLTDGVIARTGTVTGSTASTGTIVGTKDDGSASAPTPPRGGSNYYHYAPPERPREPEPEPPRPERHHGRVRGVTFSTGRIRGHKSTTSTLRSHSHRVTTATAGTAHRRATARPEHRTVTHRITGLAVLTPPSRRRHDDLELLLVL